METGEHWSRRGSAASKRPGGSAARSRGGGRGAAAAAGGTTAGLRGGRGAHKVGTAAVATTSSSSPTLPRASVSELLGGEESPMSATAMALSKLPDTRQRAARCAHKSFRYRMQNYSHAWVVVQGSPPKYIAPQASSLSGPVCGRRPSFYLTAARRRRRWCC